MRHVRYEQGTADEGRRTRRNSGLSRRHLIGAAASGFVVGSQGLLLPEWLVADAQADEEDGGNDHPARGVQDRKQQKRDKGRHKREHNRRIKRRRSGGDQQEAQDLGFCIKIFDMSLIYWNGSGRNHVMSVADGSPECGQSMTYRWKDQVVPARQGNYAGEVRFVGWYRDMLLDLYSVSPHLHFEAQNPAAGYPHMKVTKDDPSAPGGRRTILDQGFFVNEVAQAVEKYFYIKRLPDNDEHKIFLIHYMGP